MTSSWHAAAVAIPVTAAALMAGTTWAANGSGDSSGASVNTGGSDQVVHQLSRKIAHERSELRSLEAAIARAKKQLRAGKQPLLQVAASTSAGSDAGPVDPLPDPAPNPAPPPADTSTGGS